VRVDGPVGDAHGAPVQIVEGAVLALCRLVMVKTTGSPKPLPRVAAGASILSIQALRLQTAQAPVPRDRRVGGDLESLGGAQESLLQANLC